jgi:hypothetical protein
MNNKETICADFIKENYRYDADTGYIYKTTGINANKKVGYLHCKNGYEIISIFLENKRYEFLAHRLGYFLYYEYFPEFIDHINHDRLDNKIINLRNCSQQNNNKNIKKSTNIKTTSIYKGVCWHKGANKWSAQIQYNNKKIHLGLFEVESDNAIFSKSIIKMICIIFITFMLTPSFRY